MKRISYKVAKVIKDAGYPQFSWDIAYNCFGVTISNEVQTPCDAIAPTYLDVWLWLWKEKKIFINIESDRYFGFEAFTKVSVWDENIDALYEDNNQYTSPEEAIIAAIDYLVEHNLIK